MRVLCRVTSGASAAIRDAERIEHVRRAQRDDSARVRALETDRARRDEHGGERSIR